jgi:hypothetical protein
LSPNIITRIKAMRARRVGYVTHMGKMGTATFLEGNLTSSHVEEAGDCGKIV